jgi:hypothetical protein
MFEEIIGALSEMAVVLVYIAIAIISAYIRKFLNRLADKAAEEKRCLKANEERRAHDFAVAEIERLSAIAVNSVEQRSARLSASFRENESPLMADYNKHRRSLALRFVLDNINRDYLAVLKISEKEHEDYIGECIENQVFKQKIGLK